MLIWSTRLFSIEKKIQEVQAQAQADSRFATNLNKDSSKKVVFAYTRGNKQKTRNLGIYFVH
jgi:hypothetical protein